MSYFIYGTAGQGIRAQTDERPFVHDINVLLNGGEFADFAYTNGVAYQIGSTILLKVAGLDYWALQELSIYLGAFSMSLLFLVGIKLYKQDTDYELDIGWLPFVAACLVFGGFMKRLIETSHKAYTFSLFFLGLIVLIHSPRLSRWQERLLLITILIAMTFLNFWWGLFYGGILALVSIYYDNSDKYSAISVFPFVLAIAIPTYYRHMGDIFGWYFKTILYAALFGGDPHRGANVSSGATTSISGWPVYELFGFSVSGWILAMSGVFLVTLVAAIGGFFIFVRLRQRRGLEMSASLFLLLGIIISGVLAVLVVGGDLATLKRLVPIPGVIGVLWFSVYIRNELSNEIAEKLLVGLFIILLITAIPASNRFITDGDGTPYDSYADGTQLVKVTWAFEHQSTCAYGSAYSDMHLGQWAGFGEFDSIAEPDAPDPPYHHIYTNGPGGEVVCSIQ